VDASQLLRRIGMQRYANLTKSAILILLISIPMTVVSGQGRLDPQVLFERLQSDSTTDNAAQELEALGRSQSQTRDFLANHLPEVIESNPYDNPRQWTNAVKLAGDLKIVECVPALIRWIGVSDIGTVASTLAETSKLQTNYAAKALAMIGDPSVPSLSKVLNNGDQRDRLFAVYVLDQIHSARALEALREQAQQENDPSMKKLIDKIVAATSSKPSPETKKSD
jgi:hypothetical protein